MQRSHEVLLRVLFSNKPLSSSYFLKLSTIFKGMELFLCMPQDLYPYKTKLGGACLIVCGIYYEEYNSPLTPSID